jgi:hypothetical protein
MNKSFYILSALLITLLAGCGINSVVKPTAAPPGLEQSATFTVRENHVMRLAAGTSGEGTLVFRGWEHRFVFTDAKIEVAGQSDVEVHGTVFNLQNLEDFEGTYHAVKAEFDSGHGLKGAWGRNEKGVVVHLVTKGEDVTVNLEATGAKVKLK